MGALPCFFSLPFLFTRYIPIRIEFRIAVSTSLFCSSFEKVDKEVDDDNEEEEEEVAGSKKLLCSRSRSLEKNFFPSNVCVLEDELFDIIDAESSSLVISVWQYRCMLLDFALACGVEGRTEYGLSI